MSAYSDIKATLDSPGMKYIVKALREYHKGCYRKYQTCTIEQLAHIQATQKFIHTDLPMLISMLMNAHVPPKKKKEWFFEAWIAKFVNKID